MAQVEVSALLVTQLRLLVTHGTDLVADRVRLVNRLRDTLSDYFRALERSFDYAHSQGALVLLTGYQIPSALRRIGHSRLRAWLVKRKRIGPGFSGGSGRRSPRTGQPWSLSRQRSPRSAGDASRIG